LEREFKDLVCRRGPIALRSPIAVPQSPRLPAPKIGKAKGAVRTMAAGAAGGIDQRADGMIYTIGIYQF
jgi:hypothetical protein